MKKPTHEHKTPWSLEQWHVSTCKECGLPLAKKVQEYFGKHHLQTLPELPNFGFDQCLGDCAP
jgi:hypothetical protein